MNVAHFKRVRVRVRIGSHRLLALDDLAATALTHIGPRARYRVLLGCTVRSTTTMHRAHQLAWRRLVILEQSRGSRGRQQCLARHGRAGSSTGPQRPERRRDEQLVLRGGC